MQVCFTPKSEVEIFASTVMNSGAELTCIVGEQFGSASKPSSAVEERIAASLNESHSISNRSAPLAAAGMLNAKPDVAWPERTTAVLVA